MKIILNKCYGRFEFSQRAEKLILRNKHLTDKDKDIFLCPERLRCDSEAISVVQALGVGASVKHTSLLQIAEIPDNYYFKVDNIDGWEYLYYSATPILTQYGTA